MPTLSVQRKANIPNQGQIWSSSVTKIRESDWKDEYCEGRFPQTKLLTYFLHLHILPNPDSMFFIFLFSSKGSKIIFGLSSNSRNYKSINEALSPPIKVSNVYAIKVTEFLRVDAQFQCLPPKITFGYCVSSYSGKLCIHLEIIFLNCHLWKCRLIFYEFGAILTIFS
jgi:hypothetical protein